MPVPLESAGGEKGGEGGSGVAIRQEESNVLVFVRHLVVNLKALHAHKLSSKVTPVMTRDEMTSSCGLISPWRPK